jgi:hypothetical protein
MFSLICGIETKCKYSNIIYRGIYMEHISKSGACGGDKGGGKEKRERERKGKKGRKQGRKEGRKEGRKKGRKKEKNINVIHLCRDKT